MPPWHPNRSPTGVDLCLHLRIAPCRGHQGPVRTTFVGALRHDGLTAPNVINGPINGSLFLADVQQKLVPALRHGDIVVMDNLASHKVAGVREAIEAVGSPVVYLPPYSPVFNPIELLFGKLKHLVRGATPQSLDAPWESAGPPGRRLPTAREPPLPASLRLSRYSCIRVARASQV